MEEKGLLVDRNLTRVMEYGIYILVLFLFADKGEAFRSFGLYVPPLVLLLLILLNRGFNIDLRQPVFIVFFTLTMSGVISTLFAADPKESFHFFRKTYLKDILLYLVMVATFSDRDRLKRLIYVLALTAFVFTLYAYYDFIMQEGGFDYSKTRKYSSILAYLTPFLPFAIIANRDRRLIKWFWVSVLIFSILAVLLAGARGGWLSLSVSLGIWAFFIGPLRNIKTMVSLFIGCIIIGSLLLLVIPAGDHLKQRIGQGFYSSGRVEVTWKPHLEIYSNSPLLNKLFGHGLDKKTMFSSYQKWYKESKVVELDRDFRTYNPHNIYLYFLFKQGLLGAGLYILLILVYVGMMLRALLKETCLLQKCMGIAIITPFIGEYVVRGLVEDLRFMPLGILIGLVGAYLSRNGERDANAVKEP